MNKKRRKIKNKINKFKKIKKINEDYLWNNLKNDLGNFPRYAATAIATNIIPNNMKIRLYGINRNVIPTKRKINPSIRIAALVQLGSKTDKASVHPTTTSTTVDAITSKVTGFASA